MGHFEDKLWFVMEEVNRLGVGKKFDKETDRLRGEYPYMETRDLFEKALNNIKNKIDE
tara:strand:+ start:3205 stop:3378 length:174 start_codon:yes stop_codon:yes gene_type:complete